jgi:hypothetical protein
MLFEIKNATLAEVKDTTSGTSKSGNAWTKATAVIEHKDGNYTDTYPMLVFGDRIHDAEALQGKTVDVRFSIQSREYNGRTYIDLRLQYIAEAQQAAAPAPAPAPAKEDDPDGDLPF